MRYAFTFLILSFLSANAFSQDGTLNSAADADPRAKEILEKLDARFQSSESATFDFELSIELPGEAAEVQSGTLVRRGQKFVFELGEQKIFSDNQSIWVYDIGMNTVQIYDADFGDDGSFMSPNDFLEIYNSDDYTYAITNEFFEGNETRTVIDFKPLEDESEYFKVRLELAGKNHDIAYIKVFAKDGSRYTLDIANIDTEKKYSESHFVFNVDDYEDIQVENLRID